MKQIKDHVAAINKKQMPFENRVKVITSRINRVNNRDYKIWLKTIFICQKTECTHIIQYVRIKSYAKTSYVKGKEQDSKIKKWKFYLYALT